MPEYVIRALTADEVQTAVDWAGREGWNPGLHDAVCFRSSDPEGFKGGFLDGQMIASASAVNYDDTYSFLGFYIVHPDYRGSGYGLQVAEAVKAHCEHRNMGMDGVVEQQDNYRKFGFDLAYDNYRFSCSAGSILDQLGRSEHVRIAALDSLTDELRSYDRGLFPAARDTFLHAWLDAPNHASRVFEEDGQIKGYATLRRCLSGYKVGPLFADSPEIAEALLVSLLMTLPADQSDAEIFIDMPNPNAQAMAMAQQLGMTKVFETGRMYSSHAPDIDLDRIYGITTFELG
ncbi:GNAT family N-acetyltransferase [Roseibium sp. RKSG952]|uniref:GNAT family N-acetyltransferase n=1 Tax=Roseibium sp. RKSG952 TaxID=2529384 RepID=UPI0012BD0E01|nr:GNAT family N-acetyltransferase [Roseibium sp. RKSG952]MTI01747.1 GNAT family N-acetyltransferase [Roseibium sp. RKSG952]